MKKLTKIQNFLTHYPYKLKIKFLIRKSVFCRDIYLCFYKFKQNFSLNFVIKAIKKNIYMSFILMFIALILKYAEFENETISLILYYIIPIYIVYYLSKIPFKKHIWIYIIMRLLFKLGILWMFWLIILLLAK